MKKSYNLLFLFGLLTLPSSLRAQSTAFTYQGHLAAAGRLASGNYDLTFALFKDSAGGNAAAGPLLTNAIAVTNGLLTVVLDFGSGVFDGTSYWLEIGVRTNGESSFTTLSPRQILTPTPNAVYAQGAAAAGLTGTIPASSLSGRYDQPVTFTGAGNSFSGDGSGLTGVDAATLQGLAASQFLTPTGNGGGLVNLSPGNIAPGTASIDITGNANTASYANYTGIASNAPGSAFALDVKGDQINEGEIFINSDSFPGGGITLSSDGGIKTGGYVSVGLETQVDDLPAAGNEMVLITCDVPSAIVMYGGQPFISDFDQVKGGSATSDNFPSGCNTFTLGLYGQVVLNNPLSQSCDIYEPQFQSPQLVFQSEVLTNLGAWSPTNYWGITQVSNVFTIGPMVGISNHMSGVEPGAPRSYVEGSVFPALVIATNGNVGIGTASPKNALDVAGAVSATSFIHASDRNLKDGFSQVDAREVLEAVAALPIQRWHFLRDSQTQHIGPMAQDFRAAFNVGPDDKHIDTVDADGVALAAIQGLNQKLSEALVQKQTEITELKQRLDKLEQLLTANGGGKGDSANARNRGPSAIAGQPRSEYR